MLVKEKCIVLSSIRWKDSSKIVTLFSRQNGCIKVIARGALRKNSAFSGTLETLNLIDVVIVEKTTRSLQILTEVDLTNDFRKIKLMPDHFPYAIAILEIINQVFEASHSEPVYFDFLVTIMKELEFSSDPEALFWYFLIKTSSFLGFKHSFSNCHSCGKKLIDSGSSFSLASGISYCPDCSSPDISLIALSNFQIKFLISLQSYPYKKARNLTRDKSSMDFTSLLIRFLNYHLDKHISLNSLSLLP